MQRAASLTLNEAGFVVGQSGRVINRAIERENLKVDASRRGSAALRTIGPTELRYLAISGEVAKDLTPAARRRLYGAIRNLPEDATTLELGIMRFRLRAIDHAIAERLDRLAAARAAVEERPGADPVIRGTDASVHAVATQARERSTIDVPADVPGQTPTQIEAARDYAAIYPRAGRPPPIRSFKRMLAGMAASGVWDIEDDEPIVPRPNA